MQPDPAEVMPWDGVPPNPDREGWHWLRTKGGERLEPWFWTDEDGGPGDFGWREEGGDGSSGSFARWFTYHAPCEPPAALAQPPAAPPSAEQAFENYVQDRWGGWTEYAKVHTQTSGRMDREAFEAGYKAAVARLRASAAEMDADTIRAHALRDAAGIVRRDRRSTLAQEVGYTPAWHALLNTIADEILSVAPLVTTPPPAPDAEGKA